ncbi:MAG: hypothetical protein HYZ83_04235 [Candidatus Omnitrophica bacterium]|nr:hypothetical protein [Candidatus Omnitrophota bacterium]
MKRKNERESKALLEVRRWKKEVAKEARKLHDQARIDFYNSPYSHEALQRLDHLVKKERSNAKQIRGAKGIKKIFKRSS